MEPDFSLDPETHEKIYQDIEKAAFLDNTPVERPRVIITGGQPGSGKSRLLEDSKKDFPGGNVVVINGDELRREHDKIDQILEFDDKRMAEFTDPDSRVWTKKLFDKAIENKYNIIFESTLRDPGPISETMAKLKKEGYDLAVKVVATPKWSSITGIFGRYEDMKKSEGYGRWSDLSSHDAGYKGLPESVGRIEKDKLVDKLEVYSRPGKLLYSNEVEKGEWKNEPGAVKAIEAERERPPRAGEKEDFHARWDRILDLMKEREAPQKEIEFASKTCQKIEKEYRELEKASQKEQPAKIEKSAFLDKLREKKKDREPDKER